MKKVFLSLAVLFSVALVSCGGNKQAEESQEAPAAEEVVDVVATAETVPGDSGTVDTVVAVEGEAAAADAQPEAGK